LVIKVEQYFTSKSLGRGWVRFCSLAIIEFRS
jgi:hypothetical protein